MAFQFPDGEFKFREFAFAKTKRECLDFGFETGDCVFDFVRFEFIFHDFAFDIAEMKREFLDSVFDFVELEFIFHDFAFDIAEMKREFHDLVFDIAEFEFKIQEFEFVFAELKRKFHEFEIVKPVSGALRRFHLHSRDYRILPVVRCTLLKGFGLCG